MPVFGLPENKKPKTVADNLGLGNQGGVVNPPRSGGVQDMTEGAPMGSLAERALGRRQEQMNGNFDQPGRANFFNRRKKRELNGISNETSGFGQS